MKTYPKILISLILKGTLQEAIEVARTAFKSKIGDCTAEGLVGRPVVNAVDSHGHRVITKLKTKDFKNEII